jgi:glycosidase
MATNFVMRQVLKKIRFDAPTVDTSQKVAEEWINTVIKTSSWTCYTCDAGFMDAANHIFKNRSRPTGHVFKQYCSNVQIDLQGGDHINASTTNNNLSASGLSTRTSIE